MTRHPRPRYNCPWLTATIRAVRPCQFRPLGSAPSSWGDEENPGNPYEKWWILGPFTCYDPTKSYDQWGYNIGFFLCPNLEQLGSKQENWRSLVRLLDYPWIGLFGKKTLGLTHCNFTPRTKTDPTWRLFRSWGRGVKPQAASSSWGRMVRPKWERRTVCGSNIFETSNDINIVLSPTSC